MLRARLSDGLFILGLDAGNVRRLQEGQPIVISLAEMGGTDDVCIMYGGTLEDIKKELEAHLGELPKESTLAELRKSQ